MQQAIVDIPFLQLWSVFLSSAAADSQQQAGTSQGEQLIKLIRATESQVQTGSAEVTRMRIRFAAVFSLSQGHFSTSRK